MTCKDCLSALATESLREMTPDSAVMQHCATCPDCARVTTALRDREYETATVLNGLPPMSNPLTVAETAVRTAQRRRVGRVAVMISGAALVVTLWIVAATIVIPALDDGHIVAGSTLRTETMQLTCLSPQQAGDIINPYVRARGGTYYASKSGISAITVRGTSEELAKSRDLIREFEKDPGAACRAPATLLRELDKQILELQGPPTANAPVVAPENVPNPLKK
ncbi:MAG: hypothetical protein M3P26_17430 [Gemmatimonadota bacterium]|nr:hypothetical protein [Gemmatimonadota bacterium]